MIQWKPLMEITKRGKWARDNTTWVYLERTCVLWVGVIGINSKQPHMPYPLTTNTNNTSYSAFWQGKLRKRDILYSLFHFLLLIKDITITDKRGPTFVKYFFGIKFIVYRFLNLGCFKFFGNETMASSIIEDTILCKFSHIDW